MKQLSLVVLLSVGLASIYGQDAVTDPGFLSNPGDLPSKDGPLTYYSLQPLPVIFLGNYDIISSTLGIGGLSNTIITDEGTYYISNSIGQASVIGTFKKSGYSVRQGFQQPFISATDLRPPFENTLSANLYPNPFSHSISISFGEIIDEDVFIAIYNITGRIVLSEKLPASQLIVLPLEEIFDGIYILRITSGNKNYRANLIKQYQ